MQSSEVEVMEDHSIALRRKDLALLEQAAEKIGKISVFGGLVGVSKER